MLVKKSNGRAYGAVLTVEEQRALDLEIRRQTAEFDQKNANELEAIVLWTLYSYFEFDEIELKQMLHAMKDGIDALTDRYLLPDSDTPWLCTQLLKDHGIDIDKMLKEM